MKVVIQIAEKDGEIERKKYMKKIKRKGEERQRTRQRHRERVIEIAKKRILPQTTCIRVCWEVDGQFSH